MYDLNENSITQTKIVNSYNDMKMNKVNLFDIENKDFNPYQKPCGSLTNIRNLKLPLEKMLLIANLSIGVTNSVNDFWKEMKNHFDSSLLDINADELMAIFIYIIMKSQLPELVVHLNIIKEFTTAVTRNSMMGYYYTTMEAAIIYIKNLKSFEDLQELNENQ